MHYGELTDRQKELARWLVEHVRGGELLDEFMVVWFGYDSAAIADYRGELPSITKGTLDALAAADLLICRANYKTTTSTIGRTHPRATTRQEEINRTCTLIGKVYEAVDNDFRPSAEASSQVSIGAIVQTMSGGTMQAVGIAEDAEVSQIVNDPALLHSQVEALVENLLDEVKPALGIDDLTEYAQAARDLREQLLVREPNPSIVRQLVRRLGLLGDIEGSISLMTKVWSILHPLLLIAAAMLE